MDILFTVVISSVIVFLLCLFIYKIKLEPIYKNSNFDYNDLIQKKISLMFFDIEGNLISTQNTSGKLHVLSSLKIGENISSFNKIDNLKSYLDTCVRYKQNVVIKVEESEEEGIIKRVDLVFAPFMIDKEVQYIVVVSQEMFSKNREAELVEKSKHLAEQNNIAQEKIELLDAQRAELETAFKKSSKHHIKLQKAMYRIEQQKKELEEALDIINNQKAELERVNVEITKSNEMKEIFLANTSHEIRTPLNAIIGYTNLLMKQDVSEQQLQYLTNIRNSGNNLLFIINDILDLSKIEAGKMELESTNFEFGDMLNKVISSFSLKRDDKNVNINVNIDKNIPTIVVGDPHRITQILTNLLNNSVKFTGFDCVINVNISLVRIDNDDIEIQFIVSDNGIGIAKDKQTEIFQSFTQANKDTTRKYGGTGLGLSITKQLVEMYGGKITVESELGLGTSFTFNLVLKMPVFKPNTEQQNVEKIDNKCVENVDANIKLLLVEDNDINQQLATDTLQLWNKNIQITIANNGQEAVDIVSKADFDIILMDIQMPIMDGNSATKIIRRFAPPKCNIPIIAMTAHAFKEEQNRCLSNGMNDYILKPFDPNDLFTKICKYANIDTANTMAFQSIEEREQPFNIQPLIDVCSSNYDELQRYIDVYDISVPTDIEKLVDAYYDNNKERMKLKIHALKTAFNYMGMTSLLEMLDSVTMLMNEENADIDTYISRISEEWESVIPLVKKYVAEMRIENSGS